MLQSLGVVPVISRAETAKDGRARPIAAAGPFMHGLNRDLAGGVSWIAVNAG